MNLKLKKRWLTQQEEIFGKNFYLTNINSTNFKKNDDSKVSLIDEILSTEKKIFGIGNTDAEFVFIGEALVSDNSNLLKNNTRIEVLFNKILNVSGFKDSNIYKIYFYTDDLNKKDSFKYNNSDYKQFLKNLIKIISPKLVILLGELTARLYFNKNISINQTRDKVFKLDDIDLINTYHPIDLIKNPNLKRPLWEDFKKIKNNYIQDI
ncbi:MAG: uracil-DNA glycosylase family protein [Candidatus Neomarinimicrobiota bacterium]|nr:uracil-DNA glycosylase family protein [Candidatus Neomarinimicrobiota bacterium]